jgi:hypothetical protein
MKPIIYLDMDGTIADFEGWAFTAFGPEWKIELEKSEWGRFQNHPALFLHLPVMDGAKDMYDACVELTKDRNRVQILTALPNRAKEVFKDAAMHKILWARSVLHPDIRVVFGPFAQDKQYHIRHKHDILIDDMERNIDQWEAAGGIGILHKSCKESTIEVTAHYRKL